MIPRRRRPPRPRYRAVVGAALRILVDVARRAGGFADRRPAQASPSGQHRRRLSSPAWRSIRKCRPRAVGQQDDPQALLLQRNVIPPGLIDNHRSRLCSSKSRKQMQAVASIDQGFAVSTPAFRSNGASARKSSRRTEMAMSASAGCPDHPGALGGASGRGTSKSARFCPPQSSRSIAEVVIVPERPHRNGGKIANQMPKWSSQLIGRVFQLMVNCARQFGRRQ